MGKGSGLGLSMGYGFVRQSDGHVTIGRAPGEGTIVQLRRYRLLEAANGHQALEQFMQHPDIALVFSDVMLPGGLLGVHLADTLRERRPGLKVLMTSAFSESAIMHRGILDGSMEVLTKPYRVEDLARGVRAILDEQETKRVPA